MEFPDDPAVLDAWLEELDSLDSNPLAGYWFQALVNAARWRIDYGELAQTRPPGWLGLYPQAVLHAAPKHGPTGRPLYPTRETAGVAGTLEFIHDDADLRPVFLNELTYQIHGPDIIAQRVNDGSYVVCEAKGTTAPLKTPPGYLRPTVRSGRQLSWEWCQETTMRFSAVPAAAEAFLAIAGPVLRGEVTRLLCVCELAQVGARFRLEKRHVWAEEELEAWDWLQAGRVRDALVPHLDDLEGRGLL